MHAAAVPIEAQVPSPVLFRAIYLNCCAAEKLAFREMLAEILSAGATDGPGTHLVFIFPFGSIKWRFVEVYSAILKVAPKNVSGGICLTSGTYGNSFRWPDERQCTNFIIFKVIHFSPSFKGFRTVCH